jgi:hypothetical protein
MADAWLDLADRARKVAGRANDHPKHGLGTSKLMLDP